MVIGVWISIENIHYKKRGRNWLIKIWINQDFDMKCNRLFIYHINGILSHEFSIYWTKKKTKKSIKPYHCYRNCFHCEIRSKIFWLYFSHQTRREIHNLIDWQYRNLQFFRHFPLDNWNKYSKLHKPKFSWFHIFLEYITNCFITIQFQKSLLPQFDDKKPSVHVCN